MKMLPRDDFKKITEKLEEMARTYYKDPETPTRKKLWEMLRSFKILKKDYILRYLSQDNRKEGAQHGKRQETEITIAMGIEIYTEPNPTRIGVSVKIKTT